MVAARSGDDAELRLDVECLAAAPRWTRARRSHSEAERKRRERINAHLDTLRGLVPSASRVRVSSIVSYSHSLMHACHHRTYVVATDGQGGVARGGGAVRAEAAQRGGGQRGRRPGGRRRGRRRGGGGGGGGVQLRRRGEAGGEAREGVGVLRRPPGAHVGAGRRGEVRQREGGARGDRHRRREDPERPGARRRADGGGGRRQQRGVPAAGAAGRASRRDHEPGGAARRGELQAAPLLRGFRLGHVWFPYVHCHNSIRKSGQVSKS
ncbi:Os09g0463900 [Oryza sativa Japonica Group]|uniref:Os09g0463900 protein n=1 Tax=Oryza sativa subsp. japonica TaxID=39947 RepID=A0A0P0XNJ4_ORYSJ|nr:hypothetical protein EE612_048361 [Oryza sativa]BAT08503.1 Os09g0463900 [Oryza sativa Japonica Group]